MTNKLTIIICSLILFSMFLLTIVNMDRGIDDELVTRYFYSEMSSTYPDAPLSYGVTTHKCFTIEKNKSYECEFYYSHAEEDFECYQNLIFTKRPDSKWGVNKTGDGCLK